MKKIALVLACAASLGLWISCNNEAQELDITLHSGVDTKSYYNAGTVTAKKVTMVTIRGEEVKRDTNGEIANKPTDNKYYRDWVQTLSSDGKKLTTKEYWFYNDWNAGEDITLDNAFVSWNSNVSYSGDGASSGNESVSNSKTYKFGLGVSNNDVYLWNETYIKKSGDIYQYDGYWDNWGERWVDYQNTYGSAKLDISGSLEGNFTIGTLLKKLDSKYSHEDDYGELRGDKYNRLDERTVYESVFVGSTFDSETENWVDVYEYKPRTISANTSIYYYTDVSFTKN